VLRVCTAEVAPVRAEPDEAAEQVTQALAGEPLAVENPYSEEVIASVALPSAAQRSRFPVRLRRSREEQRRSWART